jgi:hypothetical protein
VAGSGLTAFLITFLFRGLTNHPLFAIQTEALTLLNKAFVEPQMLTANIKKNDFKMKCPLIKPISGLFLQLRLWQDVVKKLRNQCSKYLCDLVP